MAESDLALMVFGFVGTLGAGKTLFMSYLAHKVHQSRGGGLYANYALHGAERVNTWDDLFSLSDGLICLDELQVIADSRAFSKKENLQFSQWLLQTRKIGLDLFFTTQNLNQVDLRVRNVLDYVAILMRKSRRSPLSQVWIVDFQFGLPKNKFPLRHSEHLYQLYDTYQQVTMLQ